MAAAFGVLDGVRWSQSQWNIVYDPVHLRVSFRTRVSRGIKTLDLAKLDASCAQPVELLDIDADARGDVASRLRPYDQATNRALIERSVRRIRAQLPAGAGRHDGRLSVRAPVQGALTIYPTVASGHMLKM